MEDNATNITKVNREQFINEINEFTKRYLLYLRQYYKIDEIDFDGFMENITKLFLEKETATCNLFGHKLLFDNIVKDQLFNFINDYLNENGIFLRLLDKAEKQH